VADNPDVIDAIAANLAQPRRARTDAGEVEQHDLATQIAAAKFVIANSSPASGGAFSPFSAVRRASIELPGGCG